jgi:hypothetical protein
MLCTPKRPAADMPPVRVNLYSDTQTRPSPDMREAMVRAEVGDEQHGDDPTVHELCDRMAALLGKEAAVFLLGNDVQPDGARGDHGIDDGTISRASLYASRRGCGRYRGRIAGGQARTGALAIC